MTKRYPKPRNWVPKNKSKYIGDPSKIVSRSSWEIRVMNWCDQTPSVIKWSSETVVIPYFNKIDGRVHNYHVDFALIIKSPDGTTKKYLVEVKPHIQTLPPTPPKGNGKKGNIRFVEERITYETNQAKWEAAREFGKKHNMEFLVLTEYDLGLKK